MLRECPLMAMMVRIWGGARRVIVQEWDSKRAAWWDGCVRGSSALREALWTKLVDEQVVALGGAAATLLRTTWGPPTVLRQ